MIRRSSRSTAPAPAHTGRAPRRISAPQTFPIRTRLRRLAVALLAVLTASGVFPATAWAATSEDGSVAAIQDRVDPALPDGASLTVQNTSLGAQFVLNNPTPTEITILSRAGDELFKVGPDGVLGNVRSPDWYTSKTAEVDVPVPPRATDHGKPVWVRVSTDPSWGWFDTRLRDGRLTPDQMDAMDPLESFGAWSVPIRVGDRQGTAEGHFEFRPPLGTFEPTLSTTRPAPGVTLTALQGNPTPGMAVKNDSQTEVIVLGDQGEPFLRITPSGAEANELSPTWANQQGSADGRVGDATAPPRWAPAGATPEVSFSMPWADPDMSQADMYAASGATEVRQWNLSLMVGGKRVDVPGTTVLHPADTSGTPLWWWLAGTAVFLAVALAVTWWILRRRRRGNGSDDDRPEHHTGRGAHRRPVSAGH